MEKRKLERLNGKIFQKLSLDESRRAQAAVRTLTKCSFFNGAIDGDPHEC